MSSRKKDKAFWGFLTVTVVGGTIAIIYLLLWNKLTTIKKVSFAVIAIAIIAGIVVLLALPSRKMVPVFMAPINDSNTLSRIVNGIGTKIVAEIFDIKQFTVGKAIYKDQPILQISGLIGLENFFYNSYEIRASDESGEKILILLYLSNTDHSNSKRINLYIPINDKTETVYFGVNQTFIWNRNDPFPSEIKIIDGSLYNFNGTDEYSAYDLLHRFF